MESLKHIFFFFLKNLKFKKKKYTKIISCLWLCDCYVLNMDYLKKKLKKLNVSKTYDEIETRIASGWYVETNDSRKLKKFKTSEIKFRVSKNTTT